MSFIHNILNTTSGRILISIIWGIGLSLLFFYQMCDGPQCVIFKAPPADIKDYIYSHTPANERTGSNSSDSQAAEGCYSFVPYSVKCDKCPVKTNPGKQDQGGKCT